MKLYTRKLRRVLQSKYIWKLFALGTIFYSLLCEFIIPIKSNYSESSSIAIGVVTAFEIDGNLCTIHLRAKEKLIVYYYFQTEDEKNSYQDNLKLGMRLKVIGTFVNPSKNSVPNGFNYQSYLKHHQIYFLVQANSIVFQKNNNSVFYEIKNWLVCKIDKIDGTGYLRTFLLGDKSKMDSKSLESYQSNGISHLFSVSGMHVSLIVGVILFFLDKVSYQAIYKYSIIISVLLFYLFLTGFSASILRTVLMFILFAINQCFHLEIKKLDIMLMVLSVAIVINPGIIFDVGFQFSYVISLTIILMNKKINKVKNPVLKNLYLSFVCFVVSFPICIYYFYQVNFLSIVFNLIMIPIVSAVIFPLTWIVMLVPKIYPIYEVLVNILEKINEFLGCLNFLEVVFAKPSVVVVLVYYMMIGLAFWNKKMYVILLMIVLIHKLCPCWNSEFLFTTIDVGQGDCLFLKLPYNESNILIDTGGKLITIKEAWKQREETSSIVTGKIIPYLKSLGITKIDYLILTHGDYDHMGEAINLVENLKVEKVIFNCGEFNDLEKDLIKVLDNKKIPYYSCIKELNINDNKLYFLNNNDYRNENDNSSVIYTELDNHKFLFMGDAGIEVEEDLIEKYDLQDIDILKVGHHGSKTSSSEKFIDSINPKYGVISVGKNNRYGHPNASVLDNLSESKIYRTDQDGSIMFKIKNDKLEIDTCTP